MGKGKPKLFDDGEKSGAVVVKKEPGQQVLPTLCSVKRSAPTRVATSDVAPKSARTSVSPGPDAARSTFSPIRLSIRSAEESAPPPAPDAETPRTVVASDSSHTDNSIEAKPTAQMGVGNTSSTMLVESAR